MKYCDEYAALISAAVDNALTADERKKLMDHLAECPACREAYTQMLTMHEAFADWEEDVPGDLTGSVMEKIRKEKAMTKSRKRSWLPLVAAAACCALVFIGYQNMNAAQNTAENSIVSQSEQVNSTAESADMDAAADTTADFDYAAADISDSVSYTASMEEILGSENEEQLLDGVLTYFRSAPEDSISETEHNTVEPAAAAENPQTLLILTSHEIALAEWMESNSTAEGYSEAGSTAWLITVEECDALLDYLNTEGIAWEQTLVENLSSEINDLVCVVYLPS